MESKASEKNSQEVLKVDSQEVITPWKVEGKVNYSKLVDQFGCSLIDDSFLERFENVARAKLKERLSTPEMKEEEISQERSTFEDSLTKALVWLRRGIFFAHRSLDKFLKAFENDEPVFLYTGRGPSSDAMHFGHLISFLFIKWMQDIFHCPLVIQMADDEKFYFKKSMPFRLIYELGFENAKDIIACGFNPKLTFMFSNHDYRLSVKESENFVSEMMKHLPAKQVAKTFGFGEPMNIYEFVSNSIRDLNPELADLLDKYIAEYNLGGANSQHYLFPDSDINVGCFTWPVYQAAAAFSNNFPHLFGSRRAYCLVAHGIDQDPYFREARDLATKMKLLQPCSIMSKFVIPLTGPQGKMSSSEHTEGTIFLTDDEKKISDKVVKAYSGGGKTIELHRKHGGNPDEDVAFQYLRYLEFDDSKLDNIEKEFREGKMSSKAIKSLMSDKLIEFIKQHQKARQAVSEDFLKDFYAYKAIPLPKLKEAKQTEDESKLYSLLDELGIEYKTVYHFPTKTIDEEKELSLKLGNIICKCSLLHSKDKFVLYVSDSDRLPDMKVLAKTIGVKKLKNAEKNKAQELLKTEIPNVFGLLHDSDKKITVMLNNNLAKEEYVNIHPLREDATTTISYSDLMKFLTHLGYQPLFVLG